MALRAIIYSASSSDSVTDVMTYLIMCTMLIIASLFWGIVALLDKKKCLWFDKVTSIAVDFQFHVAVGVCDYCVLLCRDVIQQLMCLPHYFLGWSRGF